LTLFGLGGGDESPRGGTVQKDGCGGRRSERERSRFHQETERLRGTIGGKNAMELMNQALSIDSGRFIKKGKRASGSLTEGLTQNGSGRRETFLKNLDSCGN